LQQNRQALHPADFTPLWQEKLPPFALRSRALPFALLGQESRTRFA